MTLANKMELWVKRNKVKPLERGNKMPEKEYKLLETMLQQVGESLQTELQPEDTSVFLVATCPDLKCLGILGQMFGSKNLICYNCGKEYQLNEYKPPENQR